MGKKKTTKKRTSPVECKKALAITTRMFYIGCIMVLIGIVVGKMFEAFFMIGLVVLPGAALAGLGYYLHNRWVICPHCGAFLGEDSRMIRKMPEYCPGCGENL